MLTLLTAVAMTAAADLQEPSYPACPDGWEVGSTDGWEVGSTDGWEVGGKCVDPAGVIWTYDGVIWSSPSGVIWSADGVIW